MTYRSIAGGDDITLLASSRGGAEYRLVDGRGGDETCIQFDGVHLSEYTITMWREGYGGGRLETGSVERYPLEGDVLEALAEIAAPNEVVA